MRMLACVLVMAALCVSCGGKKENEQFDLNAAMPGYVVTAESITSLVANELGAISGAPTPGALLSQSCMKSECLADTNVNQTQALFSKTALGCRSKTGALDGSVFMRVSNIPEFGGCATHSGPFHFKHWPPSGGRIIFAFGQHELFSATSLTNVPPTGTLDRLENNSTLTRNWGTASIRFNGSRNATLSLDQWTQTVDAHRRDNDPNAKRFHFQSGADIDMHMDTPWDSSDRTFTGEFQMLDRSRKNAITVILNNVAYRKELCCHPITGDLTLKADVSSNPDDGTASFTLRFSEVCGEATLYNGLGHPQALRLPGCAT